MDPNTDKLAVAISALQIVDNASHPPKTNSISLNKHASLLHSVTQRLNEPTRIVTAESAHLEAGTRGARLDKRLSERTICSLDKDAKSPLERRYVSARHNHRDQ